MLMSLAFIKCTVRPGKNMKLGTDVDRIVIESIGVHFGGQMGGKVRIKGDELCSEDPGEGW